jgi:hypothetical protein
MRFLGGVNEKILEGPKQERAKPATISIGMLQPVALKYCHKKILGEVLGVLD